MLDIYRCSKDWNRVKRKEKKSFLKLKNTQMKTMQRTKTGNKSMLNLTLNLLIQKSFQVNGLQNVKEKIKMRLKSTLLMYSNNSKASENMYLCTPSPSQLRTSLLTLINLTIIISNSTLPKRLQFLKRSSPSLKKVKIRNKKKKKLKQVQFREKCKEII